MSSGSTIPLVRTQSFVPSTFTAACVCLARNRVSGYTSIQISCPCLSGSFPSFWDSSKISCRPQCKCTTLILFTFSFALYPVCPIRQRVKNRLNFFNNFVIFLLSYLEIVSAIHQLIQQLFPSTPNIPISILVYFISKMLPSAHLFNQILFHHLFKRNISLLGESNPLFLQPTRLL